MISVIVPVYNVESLLPRCIDSILAQAYSDFELLLIDDGSKDQGGKICDEYAAADHRVKAYHKPNGGLSDARNFGLDRMRGEYVTFIDSDDYIGPDYLRILVEMMEANDADITSVALKKTGAMQAELEPTDDHRCVLEGDRIFKELLLAKDITWSAWAKLYRAELFNSTRFPVGKLFEDLLTIPYIFDAHTVCVCSTSVQYYYYQRPGSIMNSISDAAIQMWLEGMDKLIMFTRQKYPQYNSYAEAVFVQGVFWRAVDWKLNSDDYYNYAGAIRKRYAAIFRKTAILPMLNAKERIKGSLFYMTILGYRRIRVLWIRAIGNEDNRHFIQMNGN